MTATRNGKASRSGSRSRKDPKTKAQRLTRVAELTERIDARQAEVEALGSERVKVIEALRDEDGATYAEIAVAAGKSPQAIHKAVHRTSNQ